MGLTFTEKAESRRSGGGNQPWIELVYHLTGTSDDGTARDTAAASTATTYEGLTRQSIDLEPIWVDTGASDGEWTVTVRYGLTEPPAKVGESSFSFDTSGGTQHITHSLATSAKYPPATAPDYKGAIGVTRDSVEGVDITVPVYAWSETHVVGDKAVTAAYRGRLFSLTGKVNNASFKGCAAGECLFLGATGARRGAEDWEITFRFAASPNRTGITIGNIAGIAKGGWEYLWIRYEDEVDEAANALVKRPVAVYVEQVYQSADFSELGIGT